jgi:hypothetical protein
MLREELDKMKQYVRFYPIPEKQKNHLAYTNNLLYIYYNEEMMKEYNKDFVMDHELYHVYNDDIYRFHIFTEEWNKKGNNREFSIDYYLQMFNIASDLYINESLKKELYPSLPESHEDMVSVKWIRKMLKKQDDKMAIEVFDDMISRGIMVKEVYYFLLNVYRNNPDGMGTGDNITSQLTREVYEDYMKGVGDKKGQEREIKLDFKKPRYMDAIKNFFHIRDSSYNRLSRIGVNSKNVLFKGKARKCKFEEIDIFVDCSGSMNKDYVEDCLNESNWLKSYFGKVNINGFDVDVIDIKNFRQGGGTDFFKSLSNYRSFNKNIMIFTDCMFDYNKADWKKYKNIILITCLKTIPEEFITTMDKCNKLIIKGHGNG